VSDEPRPIAVYEEEWYLDRDVFVRVTERHHPDDIRGGDFLLFYGNVNGKARKQLASAAPDMARALLEHVEACDSCKGTGRISIRDGATRTDVECPGCSDDRAILTKAGVPLP
jgi:hypothetical protein